MKFQGELLASTPRLLELHAREIPQKDELCGAFWGSLALRAALPDLGEQADQDAVAAAAGTVLSGAPRDEDRPTGERARQDYRLALPVVDDPQLAGTAAGGVTRAIAEIAGERLLALPVAGPWEAGSLDDLVDLAIALGGPTTLVVNIGTRFLSPSHPAPEAVVELLQAGHRPPGPADWDVGHYNGILGKVSGPLGEALLMADTYAGIGWQGIHLQPMERVVEALQRPGQGRGGALLTVAAAQADEARTGLTAAGLRMELWDNGSPDSTAPPPS